MLRVTAHLQKMDRHGCLCTVSNQIIHVLPYRYVFVLVAVPCWCVLCGPRFFLDGLGKRKCLLALWIAVELWVISRSEQETFLGCLENAVLFMYSSFILAVSLEVYSRFGSSSVEFILIWMELEVYKTNKPTTKKTQKNQKRPHHPQVVFACQKWTFRKASWLRKHLFGHLLWTLNEIYPALCAPSHLSRSWLFSKNPGCLC